MCSSCWLWMLPAWCEQRPSQPLNPEGMHHVEAWAIARSLDVQPGETVLDPMCGKGTILAEAGLGT